MDTTRDADEQAQDFDCLGPTNSPPPGPKTPLQILTLEPRELSAYLEPIFYEGTGGHHRQAKELARRVADSPRLRKEFFEKVKDAAEKEDFLGGPTAKQVILEHIFPSLVRAIGKKAPESSHQASRRQRPRDRRLNKSGVIAKGVQQRRGEGFPIPADIRREIVRRIRSARRKTRSDILRAITLLYAECRMDRTPDTGRPGLVWKGFLCGGHSNNCEKKPFGTLSERAAMDDRTLRRWLHRLEDQHRLFRTIDIGFNLRQEGKVRPTIIELPRNNRHVHAWKSNLPKHGARHPKRIEERRARRR